MRVTLLLALAALLGGCDAERINNLEGKLAATRSTLDSNISAVRSRVEQLEAQNLQLREAMEQSADLQPRVVALEADRAEHAAAHDALAARIETLEYLSDQQAAIQSLQEEVAALEDAQELERNGSTQLAALGGLLALSPLLPLWSARRREDTA